MYRFCHLAYSNHSSLQFDEFLVSSQVGSQQGDPLGGLLFCLAIHPTLLSLSSSLSIGFMDDITLGGIISVVASDVELFQAEGSKIGLDLNVSKCESISRSHDHREQAFRISSRLLLKMHVCWGPHWVPEEPLTKPCPRDVLTCVLRSGG